MADELYLSLWPRGFTEHNMGRYYARLLSVFPFSSQSTGTPNLRVYALEYQEPPLFERSFDFNASVDDVAQAVKEFLDFDCAATLECWWDLWQFENDWQLLPSWVSIDCYGPQFQNDVGDRLRIGLGPDSNFLPQPDLPDSLPLIQSNIKGLLQLVGELERVMNLEKRLLWSESDEDFASGLEATLG